MKVRFWKILATLMDMLPGKKDLTRVFPPMTSGVGMRIKLRVVQFMDKMLKRISLAGLFLLLLFNSVGAETDPSLVACWNFNEGKGDTAKDASSYRNDATIYGATWVKGISGSALEFNGINSYLVCANSDSLNMGADDFTIEAWVKTSYQSDENQTIVSKGSGAHNDNVGYVFKVWGHGGGCLQAQLNNGKGATINSSTTASVVDGDWHHLAVVFKRNRSMQVYLDGKASGTPVDISTKEGEITSPAALYIGKYLTAWYFKGILDEIRIYKRTLTESEIKSGRKEVLTESGLFTRAWWNQGWHFRAPVEVPAIGSERTDFPVEIKANFSFLLSNLSGSGNFDENSIRIVEARKGAADLPYTWTPSSSYNPEKDASGNLVWVMEGTTLPDTKRLFYVYFDTLENGKKASPSFSQPLPTDNLVKNPGFEDVIENARPKKWQEERWSKESFLGVDKEIKHSGDYALKIDTTKAAGTEKPEAYSGGYYSEKIPVNPGDSVKVSVYVRVKNLPPGGAKFGAVMHVVAQNSEGRDICNAVGAGWKEEKEGWQKMEAFGVLPPKTAYALIHLSVSQEPITVWFDDVELKCLNVPLEVTGVEKREDTDNVSLLPYLISLKACLNQNTYDVADKEAFLKLEMEGLSSTPLTEKDLSLRIDFFQGGKILRTEQLRDVKERLSLPLNISSLGEGDYLLEVNLLDKEGKKLNFSIIKFSKTKGPFD